MKNLLHSKFNQATHSFLGNRLVYDDKAPEASAEKALEKKWTTTPEGRSKLYSDASRYIKSKEAADNPELKAHITDLVNKSVREEGARKEYAKKTGQDLFKALRKNNLFVNPDEEDTPAKSPEPVKEPVKPAAPEKVEEKINAKDVLAKLLPEDSKTLMEIVKSRNAKGEIEDTAVKSFQQLRFDAMKEKLATKDSATHATTFFDYINAIFKDSDQISAAEKKAIVGKTRNYDVNGVATTVAFKEISDSDDTGAPRSRIILEVTSKSVEPMLKGNPAIAKLTGGKPFEGLYMESISTISSINSIKTSKKRPQTNIDVTL